MNFEDRKWTMSQGMQEKARNLSFPPEIPKGMELC